MTTPARRRSPAVYRRRRLLVLLTALLVVAAVVWLLVAQPWRGDALEQTDGATTSTPSRSTTPPSGSTSAPTSAATTPAATAPATTTPSGETPAAEGTPAPVPACTAAGLTVEAITDATEYAAGQNPQLSIRLTNRGPTDCTMNVGTTGQTFTVLSGDDVWWRSTDCQTDSADQIVTLAAGQSVTSVAPLAWDRTRSSIDTCTSERPGAPGGGATYRLSVSIGGVSSTNQAGFLLY